MAESTLSIDLTELRRHVCRFLGYGSDYTAITAGQQSQIDDCIVDGLRQFYSPQVLPGEKTAHSWSFAQQMTNIKMISDQSDYTLPDDFGGFVDAYFEFVSTDNAWFVCELTNEHRVKAAQMRQGTFGLVATQPQLAAVTPLPTDGTTPQRFGLMVWPTPKSDYTLIGKYYIDPQALSPTTPYPLGGQPHADTLRLSCLAAAEQDIDDNPGQHKQKFLERLIASVSLDRNQMTPRSFGINNDRSSAGRAYDRHWNQSSLVTYNGQVYQQ